jgi:hypothetical protein
VDHSRLGYWLVGEIIYMVRTTTQTRALDLSAAYQMIYAEHGCSV